MVITSDGRCVSRDDPTLDRCLNPRKFTQAVVASKCQINPTAVFADPFNCTMYYNCSKSPARVQCPSGQNYDDINKVCADAATVLCSERPVNYTKEKLAQMCAARPTLKTGKPNSCNVYVDCSLINDPTNMISPDPNTKECTYPELYDPETKSCKPFSQVDCMLRTPEKNPCALNQRRCGRSVHCMPCELNYPDCSNQTDGSNPIPLKLYSPQYVECKDGWNIGVRSCEPAVTSRGLEVKVFDARDNKCRSIYSVPRSLGGLGPETP